MYIHMSTCEGHKKKSDPGARIIIDSELPDFGAGTLASNSVRGVHTHDH